MNNNRRKKLKINRGFKILALLSILAIFVSFAKFLSAPIGTTAHSLAEVKLMIIVFVFTAIWILFLIDQKYKSMTGESYIKNKILGRDQASSYIQGIDKSRKDNEHRKNARRNRADNQKSNHPQGIIFGRKNDQWVFSPAIDNGSPHAIIYGPSGSGKTQNVILPTIASWPKNSHIFAVDVSGDISQTINTNPWMRSEKYLPLDFTSWNAQVRFDIFAAIRKKAEEAKKKSMPSEYIQSIQKTEIEKISICLIPPPAVSDNSNTYFIDGGRDLLCAGLMAGFFNQKGFIETLRYIAETPLNTLLPSIEKSGVKTAAVKVRQFAGQNDKNISGVRGEAVKAAEKITKNAIAARVLTPPTVGENATLLSPSDIESHDIFVRINMTDIALLSPVIGLIIRQITDYFYTRDLVFASTHPILVIADEIASYCRYWGSIENDIRNLRKFGIRIIICAQDFGSIDAEIGKSKRQTLIANTALKVILGSFVPSDQQELSNLIGKEEQRRRTRTYSPYQRTGYTDRWEMLPVVPPEDFGTLIDRNNLILLSPKGWEQIETSPFWKYREQLHDAVSNQFTWQHN